MKYDQHLGFYKHGNLPHLDSADSIQFLTFVLADAAPVFRKPRHQSRIPGNGAAIFRELDGRLDRCMGSCLLREENLAAIIAEAIQREDRLSCDVLAWVVMPNHVHLLLRQLPGCRIGKIVKDIKGSSARHLNMATFLSGKVWQRGYFDRVVRDLDQLKNTVEYIHENPVNAGLCTCSSDWRMSSAGNFTLEDMLRRLGWS